MFLYMSDVFGDSGVKELSIEGLGFCSSHQKSPKLPNDKKCGNKEKKKRQFSSSGTMMGLNPMSRPPDFGNI